MNNVVARNRIALVALAALAGAVATGCTGAASGTDAEATSAAPILIGQENIAVGAYDTLEAGPAISGTIEAEQTAALRAQLSGTVREIRAEAGQRVRRGALLARIEDRTLSDALTSARARAVSAEAAATVARRELQRQVRLVAVEAVAEREVEAAQETLAAAEATLAEARTSAASAYEQLAHTRVTAPFGGVISERSVSSGDVVQAGAELFKMIEPSRMRLEGSVPAEELSAVKIGMSVAFAVRGYASRTFTGRVARLNPAADPSTRQVKVYVSLPNDSGELVSGLFARGRVVSRRRAGIVVPLSAIDSKGSSAAVVRLRGGRVERAPVQLGLRDDRAGLVEVAGGVAEGDTLLTGTPQDLAPGTRVKVAAAALPDTLGSPVETSAERPRTEE